MVETLKLLTLREYFVFNETFFLYAMNFCIVFFFYEIAEIAADVLLCEIFLQALIWNTVCSTKFVLLYLEFLSSQTSRIKKLIVNVLSKELPFRRP